MFPFLADFDNVVDHFKYKLFKYTHTLLDGYHVLTFYDLKSLNLFLDLDDLLIWGVFLLYKLFNLDLIGKFKDTRITCFKLY